jgi:uncharacterized protein (TIGR02996 family)
MSLLVASEADFEKALDENPDDWNMRLMYSDWLKEQGQDDRATFLRLMANQKKRPNCTLHDTHNTPWGWSHDVWSRPLFEIIGKQLFVALPRLPDLAHVSTDIYRTAEGRSLGTSGHSWFLTRQSAERALYNAWLVAGKPNDLG